MRFRTTAELAAAMAIAAAQAVTYPLEITVHNNTFLANVEPETGTFLAAYSSANATVRDGDQLLRVLSNIEQLNAVNRWVHDAGLSVEHETLSALWASAEGARQLAVAAPAGGAGSAAPAPAVTEPPAATPAPPAEAPAAAPPAPPAEAPAAAPPAAPGRKR